MAGTAAWTERDYTSLRHFYQKRPAAVSQGMLGALLSSEAYRNLIAVQSLTRNMFPKIRVPTMGYAGLCMRPSPATAPAYYCLDVRLLCCGRELSL